MEPFHQYCITFCCRVTDGSRGAVWQNGVWHGSEHEEKVCHWIPPWHPLTFTDICWMFMETKQWMWAQWCSGWCVLIVVTAMWKKPQSGWPCTASQHKMKSASINLSVWSGGLWPKDHARSWILASVHWRWQMQCWIITKLGPTNAYAETERSPYMQGYRGWLNHYEAEGDSLLECIILVLSCQHYELESKQQWMWTEMCIPHQIES